jgi:hypothetical protein
MEILVFVLAFIAQAIPTVLAVVVGIALARWLGLFEPRAEGARVPTGRRGLALALAVVAVLLVLALLVLPLSSDSGAHGGPTLRG